MRNYFVLLLLVSAISSGAQRTIETPSGTINGANLTFTLSSLPYASTLVISKNGMRLANNVDYSLTLQSVSFTSAPTQGDSLTADYNVLAPIAAHALINKATGNCITPTGQNKIVLVSCAGLDSQKYGLTLSTFGYVIAVKSNGQALDLLSSGTADGTAIVQSALSGSKTQQWQLLPLDNDSFFEVTNSQTNGASCLTLTSGLIILQTCSGLDTQKWQWQ